MFYICGKYSSVPIMMIFKQIITVLVILLAIVPAQASGTDGHRANYQVIPLPGAIHGIKSADFALTQQRLINYPTGNRDMERNAAMLSQYIEEMTGMHLSIRPIRSTREIAERYAMKEANVLTILSRTRKILKDRLIKEGYVL